MDSKLVAPAPAPAPGCPVPNYKVVLELVVDRSYQVLLVRLPDLKEATVRTARWTLKRYDQYVDVLVRMDLLLWARLERTDPGWAGGDVNVGCKWAPGVELMIWRTDLWPHKHWAREWNLHTSDIMFRILIGMADQVRAAHRRSVFHGDIKLENFVYSGQAPWEAAGDQAEFRVSLIDWDHSCTTDVRPVRMVEHCGTKGYACPWFRKKGYLPSNQLLPADIYSLGVTFYCLIMGAHPITKRGHSLDRWPVRNEVQVDRLVRDMMLMPFNSRPNIETVCRRLRNAYRSFQIRQGETEESVGFYTQ